MWEKKVTAILHPYSSPITTVPTDNVVTEDDR